MLSRKQTQTSLCLYSNLVWSSPALATHIPLLRSSFDLMQYTKARRCEGALAKLQYIYYQGFKEILMRRNMTPLTAYCLCFVWTVDFGLGDAVSLLGLLRIHVRSRALRSARSQYVTSNQHGGQGDFGIALWDFCTFIFNCLRVFCSFFNAELARTRMPAQAVSGAGYCEAVASSGLAAARLAFDEMSTTS